jgi:pimeloyl-ACP methyl ester carboxylesterase
VAINSAPTEGVAVVPLSQVRSTFPVLKNPANRRRAVGFDYDHWRYAFTNTFPEDQARTTYERYHIPAPGSIVWGSALANIHPGHTDTYVDYRNAGRVPLLFCSGEHDHLMPPKVQQSNAKHYKADGTTTEVMVFPGRSHLMPAQDGWQEIADHALDWALADLHSATWRAGSVLHGMRTPGPATSRRSLPQWRSGGGRAPSSWTCSRARASLRACLIYWLARRP